MTLSITKATPISVSLLIIGHSVCSLLYYLGINPQTCIMHAIVLSIISDIMIKLVMVEQITN